MKYDVQKNQTELFGRSTDLTQTYMAHYLNVNQRTYSRYERGERSVPLEQLCRIADFYKVSVDYLLGRTDVKRPYPASRLSRKT